MRIKKLFLFLSSLKLTVCALAGLLIIVFVSTLAQVDMGIYLAKKHFFEGIFVYLTFSGIKIPVFLSGYSFGVILVINLIASHIKRFAFKWEKLGIWLIHIGLLILIIGSGIVASQAVESQMAIEEGETQWFTQSTRDVELAVLKTLPSKEDQVTAIPVAYLEDHEIVEHPTLPFTLHIRGLFPNSQLLRLPQGEPPVASQGIGTQVRVTAQEPRYDDNYRNMVSAYVELKQGERSLGTWLLSTGLGAEQSLMIGPDEYRLALRPTRFYTGFSVTLENFTHDRYAGTEIPKNFQSDVAVFDPQTSVTEKFKIFMNNPMRKNGYTFYQASYGKADTLSVFQVVYNPGRILPYVASTTIGVGLLFHFLLHLIRFLRRQKKGRA